MDNKIKESLSETEKIIMIIYVIAIVLIKLIYDKLLITPIVLLGIIYVTAYRNSKNTDVNYLIKEKIELLIRHFLLLNILWNIIGLIIFQDSIFDDSITTIVINSFLFIICLLPFLGILKAISKIPEIEINKNMQIYRKLQQINPI